MDINELYKKSDFFRDSFYKFHSHLYHIKHPTFLFFYLFEIDFVELNYRESVNDY